MKPRTTFILFLIFIALGAFYYFYQYKGGEARKKLEEQAKKLLVFDKEKIQGIQLKTESENINITKTGGQWQISEPVRYNADSLQIDNLISTLKNAAIESVVLDSADNLQPFGLAPAKACVILQYTDGKGDSIFVGSKNATNAFTFAKINNQPRILLASASLTSLTEKKLFDVRDKTLLEFTKEKVKKLNLTIGTTTFNLEKIGNNWEMLNPLRTRADNDEIDKILNKVDSEKVKEFVDEQPTALGKYGLLPPILQIEMILTEQNAQKRLIVGNQSGENYFAKDESRTPVFAVSKALIDVLKTDLTKLRDKKVLHFDRYAITQIQLLYSDSTVVVNKDTANTWTIVAPDTFKTKSWKISSLLGALVRLSAQEFVKEGADNLKPYGLNNPAFVVTLTDSLKQESDILYCGNESDKDNSYVTNKDKKNVYRVKNSDLKDIKAKLNDLIEK